MGIANNFILYSYEMLALVVDFHCMSAYLLPAML